MEKESEQTTISEKVDLGSKTCPRRERKLDSTRGTTLSTSLSPLASWKKPQRLPLQKEKGKEREFCRNPEGNPGQV